MMYVSIYLVVTVILAIIVLIILLLRGQKNQIFEVREEAKIEIARAKENFLKESALIKHEYERKNREKTIELEALRKKVRILKKNQYDPRKDPTGKRKPKAFKERISSC